MNTKKSILKYFMYSSVILLLVLLTATFFNKLEINALEEPTVNDKELAVILFEDEEEDLKRSNYELVHEKQLPDESLNEVRIGNIVYRVDKQNHIIVCYCIGYNCKAIQREDRYFANADS